MKNKCFRLSLMVLIALTLSGLAFAGVPKTINYQGYLKETGSGPVNAPTKLTFSLYSSSPHRDNPIWSESQNNIDVRQGIYSVELGTLTPITAPFDIRYWLGVAVNDGPVMLPLQPLASVPYSIKSGCNPGDMINCYTGTPGTMNSGICLPGLRTCLPDGRGYSACVGEIVPAPITGCDFPNCADMAKNLNETDVDCGGSCAPCAAGKACLIAPDCENLNCENSICSAVAPTCMDAVRNGFETDIDCGGLACGPCAIGNHCVANRDCSSQICQDSFCVANPCLDGVKNSKETDVDCGGGTCLTCQNGKACNLNLDCQSGVCSNGFCAAPTCNDAVKNGSEVDVDCGGACPNKCAVGNLCNAGNDCQSGYCNNGSCAAPTCTDTVKNGSETDVDCGGNACSACQAGKICSISADCQSGLCNAGFCQNKLSQGAACASSNECQSSFCVDSVCCSSACSGTCQACNLAGQVGTCSMLPAGTDPDSECATQSQSSCGTTGVCNGAGACSIYPSGTVSSAQSCAGSTLTLSNTCNGSGGVVAGGSVSCLPYICNGSLACKTTCTTNVDCVSGFECASGACKKSSGTLCTTGVECASGSCVTGVCQASVPPDGTPCDDGNLCTVNAIYMSGICTGEAKNCADGIACTTDSCNPATGGCTQTPVNAACDDGNACTTDACDAQSGCQHSIMANGTTCGSGLTCQAGICTQ